MRDLNLIIKVAFLLEGPAHVNGDDSNLLRDPVRQRRRQLAKSSAANHSSRSTFGAAPNFRLEMDSSSGRKLPNHQG